jgi:hypothetical protein
MSARIISIDQVNGGVLVTFAEGIVSFFDAAFLYGQLDKRVEPPLTDTSEDTPSDL